MIHFTVVNVVKYNMCRIKLLCPFLFRDFSAKNYESFKMFVQSPIKNDNLIYNFHVKQFGQIITREQLRKHTQTASLSHSSTQQ